MASTISQLGVLLTDRGDIEDAVGSGSRSCSETPVDALLRTQPDEPSVANAKNYLSSAATDDQGLQRHLSQWVE